MSPNSKASETELDEGCIGVTFERKYYAIGDTFIKRSLRPREYKTGYHGLHVPRASKARLQNEAASLRYIRQTTDIPVPTVRCDFEDDGAYYVITEYVEGTSMAELAEPWQKDQVADELRAHVATMRTLRSRCAGGPSGLVVPPYRVTLRTERDEWKVPAAAGAEYVFCHNDLSQQNVIVDPDSLKIKAIVDWEYAGFYPEYFDLPIYLRLGPSVAIQDEVDDSLRLLEFLESNAVP